MSELGDLLEEFEPDFEPFWRTPGHTLNGKTTLELAESEYKLQDILSSGVYALCNDGVVIYVGKARVLVRRIYAHYNAMERVRKGLKPLKGTKGFIFNKVRIFPCSIEELNVLERKLIARFRPKHNELLVPKLLGKLTLAQVGFRFDRLGIVAQAPEPRRPIPSAPMKRRF